MSRIAHLLSYAVFAALLAAAPAYAHIPVDGLDINGQCVGDANTDREVAINELIIAVNNALTGCARLPITLNFQGVVGDREFACGATYEGVGTGSSQFIPSDFRFYVSNIKLVTVGGEEVPLELEQDDWQYQNVALIDFETGPEHGCIEGSPATNTAIHGSVPAGVYTTVKFDLGVPFDLNHADVSTAPKPLNVFAMFWSWNLGYKFLRLDTADDKVRVHLGSTGCNGGSPSHPPTPCSNLNLATVTLPGFNPSPHTIVADIGALFADSNIDMNQMDTPPGCMADPDDQDCAPIFSNLGLTFPAGTPTSTQKFFRFAAEHDEGEDVEIVIAASADGGGMLVAHPEFDVEEAIPLSFSQCFGGSGDECEGGTRLFSAVNPGLSPIEENEPAESLFTLADATQVTLELLAIDKIGRANGV